MIVRSTVFLQPKYASETYFLFYALRTFKRKILRSIFVAIQENGSELYEVYNGPDMIKFIN